MVRLGYIRPGLVRVSYFVLYLSAQFLLVYILFITGFKGVEGVIRRYVFHRIIGGMLWKHYNGNNLRLKCVLSVNIQVLTMLVSLLTIVVSIMPITLPSSVTTKGLSKGNRETGFQRDKNWSAGYHFVQLKLIYLYLYCEIKLATLCFNDGRIDICVDILS